MKKKAETVMFVMIGMLATPVLVAISPFWFVYQTCALKGEKS